jgi:hypothetical protein
MCHIRKIRPFTRGLPELPETAYPSLAFQLKKFQNLKAKFIRRPPLDNNAYKMILLVVRNTSLKSPNTFCIPILAQAEGKFIHEQLI